MTVTDDGRAERTEAGHTGAGPTEPGLTDHSGPTCYVCKQRYVDDEVDAFYHQLCPDCARSTGPAATRAPT
jgi:hypothetical protein